jgi:hypothetical protein
MTAPLNTASLWPAGWFTYLHTAKQERVAAAELQTKRIRYLLARSRARDRASDYTAADKLADLSLAHQWRHSK